MSMDYSNDVVMVTGAARGLGLAIAQSFVEMGAKVALCDVDKKAVAEASRPLGDRAFAFQLDVGDPDAVARIVEKIKVGLGPVTILVNNAGICDTKGFTELTAEDWNRTIGINLSGAFYCMQEAVKGMLEKGKGKIVNIGSLAGRSGGILANAAYGTSKAGLAGLTRAAAAQLARHHINVNCVSPSTIETPLTQAWGEEKLKALREKNPWGRLAQPEDVVGAVIFLASPLADYITGVTLDVNGGMYIAP